jgi:hypothetical protein
LRFAAYLKAGQAELAAADVTTAALLERQAQENNRR